MVQYIIQIIAFQVFFLLVYDVFLKRETFFRWNRIYLIGTSILSLILPFIKVTAFKEIVPKDYVVSLPEVFIGNKTTSNAEVILPEVVVTQNAFSWNLETLFYIGAVVATLLFMFKITHIFLLIYKNPKRWKGNVILVKLINSTSAFSFFHYVFLGSNLKEEDEKVMIKHELVHVTQKHTLDLLFFEVQRIVFWFNPLVYMYQSRVRSLHEFIADQEALKTQNKSDYYQNLLTQVFETENVSFINAFFKKSLIKKRIMMLSKSKSKQVLKLKYVLLIPVLLGMLMYTSAEAQDAKKENIDLSQYTYTLKKGKGYSMSERVKQTHNKYQLFLYSNTNYVSWAQHTNSEATYSIHHKDEARPENLKKTLVELPNGRHYTMYINWPESNQQETVMLNEIEVPYASIEQPPMFNDCETLPEDEQRKCTSDAITGHIQKNFNTDLAGDLGLSGRQVIRAVFKINKEGNIVDVSVRAPHPRLEEETKRVIKSLPQMIPGKQKGKTVIVPYSLPIIFQVAEKTEVKPSKDNSNSKVKHEEVPYKDGEVEVPFYVIEQPPMFEDCEALTTRDEQRKCTSDIITKYVQKNFNTNLAGDLNLTGKQTIRVIFKINKEGNIEGVNVRASHPKLEEEATRVIKGLPKMIPGKQKGKAVVVPYSLPIIFQVADKTDEKPLDNKSSVKHEGVSNKNQDIEVPYSHIEQPPMSKECKTLASTEEQRKCTSKAVTMHVLKNFNTNLAGDLGLSGRQTIRAMFKIDEKGKIVNIKVRAPHPKLEEETKRVIKSLPKMIPGKQKGKKVVVPYSLPIVFQVADKTDANSEIKNIANKVLEVVETQKTPESLPLFIVDESPIYPGCDTTSSNDELKECLKSNITNFIANEFGKNLPKNIDSKLEPKQKVLAMFKINKNGEIEGVRARAKNPELEKEAIRVLKSLPKMTPAKHNEKIITVNYSVPIIYEVGKKKN